MTIKTAARTRSVTKKPAAKRAAPKKPAHRKLRQTGRPPSSRHARSPTSWRRRWQMEIEAAQRYADFADAMEMHNNREVAAMFRKMARLRDQARDEIMATMGWSEAPPVTARDGTLAGLRGPETTPGDEVHYLMQPWHALQLALAAEQRAERFFAELARIATSKAVREAARELQAEEREHVALVRAWMKKVPKPERDWALDPDPPRYLD